MQWRLRRRQFRCSLRTASGEKFGIWYLLKWNASIETSTFKKALVCVATKDQGPRCRLAHGGTEPSRRAAGIRARTHTPRLARAPSCARLPLGSTRTAAPPPPLSSGRAGRGQHNRQPITAHYGLVPQARLSSQTRSRRSGAAALPLSVPLTLSSAERRLCRKPLQLGPGAASRAPPLASHRLAESNQQVFNPSRGGGSRRGPSPLGPSSPPRNVIQLIPAVLRVILIFRVPLNMIMRSGQRGGGRGRHATAPCQINSPHTARGNYLEALDCVLFNFGPNALVMCPAPTFNRNALLIRPRKDTHNITSARTKFCSLSCSCLEMPTRFHRLVLLHNFSSFISILFFRRAWRRACR